MEGLLFVILEAEGALVLGKNVTNVTEIVRRPIPSGSRTPGMMLSSWSIRSSLSFLPPRPYSNSSLLPYSNSSSSLSLYGSKRLDL